MKKLALFLTLALATATAASAGSFRLYGSYWDPDAVDDALGGGIGVGIPLGQIVELDVRGTYYEELSDEPLDALFDDDDPVFLDEGLQIIPVDVGLRFSFAPHENFNPYVGLGGTYFFLDSTRPNVDLDDELGYYALLGSRFGSGEGAGFFAEVQYRKVEATAAQRPGDDVDIIDRVDFDLDGLSANVGVVWNW